MVAWSGGDYNFGFASSAMWFRITLRADAQVAPLWYWAVAMPLLDYVDLYVSDPGGGFSHQRIGDELPMSARFGVMARVQHSMVLISMGVFVAAGVIAFRQKRPGSRYFLLAWGVLIVAAFVFSLRNIGVLPVHFLTEHAMKFGSALEMVLLSIALADRIKVTRHEQRRAETLNRVRQARKAAADQAHAEKSRFLAAISHDLRQPMYALGLLVDGLRGVRLPDIVSNALNDMKGSLTSINALLDSLLLMGRLEVGRLEPRMETFYVDLLLERVSNTFEAQAQARGAEVRRDTHHVPAAQ